MIFDKLDHCQELGFTFHLNDANEKVNSYALTKDNTIFKNLESIRQKFGLV